MNAEEIKKLRIEFRKNFDKNLEEFYKAAEENNLKEMKNKLSVLIKLMDDAKRKLKQIEQEVKTDKQIKEDIDSFEQLLKNLG